MSIRIHRRFKTLICCGITLLCIWMVSISHHLNGSNGKSLFEENRSIEDIIRERNEERIRRMKTVCGPKECLDKNYIDNLIVDEKYKVIYCYIPKVACTQWKSVFASLKGYIPKPGKSVHYPPKGTYRYLKSYPVEERSKILRDFYKFMFVREPMERLLSAYKDKFSESAKDRQFKKIWSKFVLRFVRKQKTLTANYSISFEDFLGFVNSNTVWQEHWQLSYKMCQPCAIDYDFIGHFENLEEEAPYVLKAARLNTTIRFPAYRPSNTTTELLQFYSQIPKNLIVTVANLYRTDFELFGYPFPGRLKGILQGFIHPQDEKQ